MDFSGEVTCLRDIIPGRKFSGFGIVMDSTRGQTMKAKDELYTQIKIIDSSMNPSLDNQESSKKYVTLLVYWRQTQSNPFVYKIGDIIRFLNFDFDLYNEYLQGKNRRQACWKIYHGDSKLTEPYAQSQDVKEKTTQAQVAKLEELRKWSTSFFSFNSLTELDWYSYERRFTSNNSNQSFDLFLKCEEKKFSDRNLESATIIFVDEKNNRFKHITAKQYLGVLEKGDIVKMRSVDRIEGDVVVSHSKYHGILVIPNFFKDARDFNEMLLKNSWTRVNADADEEKNENSNIYSGFDLEFFKRKGYPNEDGKIISSIVAEKWNSSFELRNISEILNEIKSENSSNSNYYLQATLVDIQPRKIEDALRNQCKNCKVFRKINSTEGEVCCMIKMEKILLVRLLWIDDSVHSMSNCLQTYCFPEDSDINRIVFPDLDIRKVRYNELTSLQKRWEEIIEKYLDGDRIFNILIHTFDNQALIEQTNSVPLRIYDTMFSPVLDK